MPSAYQFAEFFAGIGLVRLAFEDLGWHCAFANDIDPKKAEIYRQNFPEDELVVEDIFKLDARMIPVTTSLWTASFPCVDLSLAGWRRGIHGSHSSAYWGFVELLEQAVERGHAPDRVLLENVVGLVTSGGGADLAAVLGALSSLGYRYDMVIIDAKYFTPQSRPRLFITAEWHGIEGSRLVWPRPFEFDSPLRPAVLRSFIDNHSELSWGHLRLAPLPMARQNLTTMVEELPDDDELWWSQEAVDKLLGAMSVINRGRVRRMLASSRPEYGTVYRRLRADGTMAELRHDGIAGCLRTPRGGSSKQFLLEAREGRVRVRHLTVRECARLQGVPDSFRLDVPVNQAWFGLGDAVCVPAVKWLAGQFCPVETSAEALAV